MSHTPPPLTDDDLSAALDGEAGPDVLARIEADPAARDRLARLRAASEAVSRPVAPLAPAVVDDLVSAALAGRSNRPVDDGTHGEPADADHPRPRGEAPRLPTRALVAAVVVVLVAIGLGLVWSGQHQDQTSEVASGKAADTSVPDPAGTAAADRADAGTGAESGATTTSPLSHGGLATTTVAPDAAATTDTGAAGLVDLGSFDSADDLRTALADSFTTTDRTSGTDASATAEAAVPDASVTRCADQLKSALTLDGDPTHQGTAEVGAETLLVYEFPTTTDDGRATSLVAAVDTDTCSPTLLFQR